MRVRVDKPGNNSLSSEIYLLCFPGSQRLQFLVSPDSQKTAVSNGDSFGARLTIIDGDDVCIVKNQLRLDAIQW